MLGNHKVQIFILVIAVGCTWGLLNDQLKTINQGYKDNTSAHNKHIETTQSELAKLEKTINKIKTNNEAANKSLGLKIDAVDAAIHSKSKRWGNIKKVRKIIKETITKSRYPQKMNIVSLTRYAAAVVDSSTEYDVPIPLILAVTRQESAFNPKAISHAGAQGLMQLMPQTAKECSSDIGKRLSNIYHIGTNVELGTFYLRKMLTRFNNNTELAVKAYNAGPNYVSKILAKQYRRYPTETINYSKKVLAYLHEYQEHYN
tara:strand:- start:224 stop:1000 length:777 start_codon:yes stop_codon:yes gene_type:complete